MREHISVFKWKIDLFCYFGKEERKTFVFIKQFLTLRICYCKLQLQNQLKQLGNIDYTLVSVAATTKLHFFLLSYFFYKVLFFDQYNVLCILSQKTSKIQKSHCTFLVFLFFTLSSLVGSSSQPSRAYLGLQFLLLHVRQTYSPYLFHLWYYFCTDKLKFYLWTL